MTLHQHEMCTGKSILWHTVSQQPLKSELIAMACLLQASPAFATASETFVLAEKSGKEIRATQESGKASPPPKSSGTQDAPRLQSPVRDIIGKVTGGADKPPGVGTAAAPNTEDALGGEWQLQS